MTGRDGPGRRWRIAAGLAVSAVALAAAFHRVQWAEFGAALSRVRPPFILLGLVLTQLELAAGAWRWQRLLLPVRPSRVWGDCYHPFMAGYFFNQVLPMRPGEILRAFAFSRARGAPVAGVLATAVVEKLLDVVALAALTALAALVIELPPDIRWAATACGVGAVLAGVALVFACWRIERGAGESLVRWLPARVRAAWCGVLDDAVRGLRALRTPRELAGGLALSLLIWGVGVLVTQSYLWAFGLRLPWYAAALVLAVVNLGMMLPSSPGAIGVAHLLYVVSLGLVGVERSTAAAFGVVAHGVPFLQVLISGLLSLWLGGLSARRDEE